MSAYCALCNHRLDSHTHAEECAQGIADSEDASTKIGALQARVAELESAIGVMVPTIIRAFLEGLGPDAGVDRTAGEATLARINAAMSKRTGPSVSEVKGEKA